MQTYLIVAIIAYLLGSIPFGYILVRLFRKQDIRQTGSGNIGATNVARSGAKGLGIVTLVLDAAKGYAAVVIGMNMYHGIEDYLGLYMSQVYLLGAVAAIFAILGHIFPIWLKFKGGKGVATGVGVFLALSPKSVGIALVLFFVIVWFSRYVSLGSIVATAAFPVLAWIVEHRYYSFSSFSFAAMCIASLLIIYRHKDNIRRLLAGTEHRLGEKKKSHEVRA